MDANLSRLSAEDEAANSYEVSDETWNGSGSFYIENGRLHWYNAQTGEEVILIPS